MGRPPRPHNLYMQNPTSLHKMGHGRKNQQMDGTRWLMLDATGLADQHRSVFIRQGATSEDPSQNQARFNGTQAAQGNRTAESGINSGDARGMSEHWATGMNADERRDHVEGLKTAAENQVHETGGITLETELALETCGISIMSLLHEIRIKMSPNKGEIKP